MGNPDPAVAKVNYLRGVVFPKVMDVATKAASLQAAVRPVLERLAGAVKKRDPRPARDEAAALRTLLGQAKPLANEVRDALHRIAEVEPVDPKALGAGKSNLDEWKANLMKALVEIGRWAERAKSLLPEADRIVDASLALLNDADRSWAGTMRHVRVRESELRRLRERVAELDERAAAAVRKRDRHALGSVRSDLAKLERDAGVPLGDDLAQRLKDQFAKYDPKRINHPRYTAEIESERKDLDALAKSGDAARTAALDGLKKLKSVRIEAPDAARAIKVLGLKLNPGQAAKLKKALDAFDGDPTELLEVLEVLARETGAKSTAKEMREKLRREGVV